MREQILNFNKQFEFKPEIINSHDFKAEHYLICGMGGSHLAGDMLQAMYPEKNIRIHSDYGLPQNIRSDTQIIISSFSGNTEETISSYGEARKQNLPCLIITSGGELLKIAQENKVPHIALPALNIQPRMAFGYSLMAFAKALDINLDIKNTNPLEQEKSGQKNADLIFGKIPLIYSDNKHEFLAKHWKIKINETAKSPAFYNIIPEMNHNEINMFQTFNAENKSPFIAIFLKSKRISSKINDRVEIMEDILAQHGTAFLDIEFSDIIENITLADWTSYYLALKAGLDPESIPIIDSLKKALKK